jgi:hypothetical protein
MKVVVDSELNFHEQEIVSFFHETNVSGSEEEFAELVFASAFTIRTMSNLRYDEASDAIAIQLGLLSDLIINVPERLDGLKPKIILYPGHAGRKRFIATLKFDSTSMLLDYFAKGFGFFSRGIGYYANASVNSIFRYFAMRRDDDESYLNALSSVADGCSEYQKHRQISLVNHSQLVMLQILSSMEKFVPEWL